MKTHYCFLDVIYTDKEENPVAYAITKSDNCFREVEQVIVSEEELLRYTQESGVICDYQKSGGYLVTAPQVPSLIGHPEYETIYKLSEADNRLYVTVPESKLPYSIYDLITEGLAGEFVLVDASVLEQNNPQLGMVGFQSIHFSKSTMSVYALMLTEEGYKNIMLVSDNGSALQVRDFYFAVPTGAVFTGNTCCQLIQTKQLGNREYAIYHAGSLRIYDTAFSRSAALINRAAFLSERCTASIKFWQRYLKICNEALNLGTEFAPSWAGSKGNKNSIYGVYFENSYEHVKSKDLPGFIDVCMQMSLEHENDAIEYAQSQFNGSRQDLAVEFMKLEAMNSGSLEMFNAAYSLIKNRALTKLNADMFLYRVRASAFITQTLLTPTVQPFVVGGAVPTFTIVREGFRFD